MASSIHIGKVSTGSFIHNDRTQKVSYLIDSSDLNEYSKNSSDSIQEFNLLKSEAIKKYTERTNQKMQKSTVFLKEAIVNLEAHHTLKDLEPIIKKLESYGFKVIQASIHRDEGFKNSDNELEKNYHAHITMFALDKETGKSVKFGKDYRTELSKLQTLTANTLGMKRGKVSVKGHADELKVDVEKASKRLDTHEYKRAMVLKEKATLELQQENKQLKYDFREMQKKITATDLTVDLKKELHSLNTQVKNNKVGFEVLNAKIEELTTAVVRGEEVNQHLELKLSTFKKNQEKVNDNIAELVPQFKELKPEEGFNQNILRTISWLKKKLDKAVEELKAEQGKANKALEAQKTLRAENETLKAEKIVLERDMSFLRTDLNKTNPTENLLKVKNARSMDKIYEISDLEKFKKDIEKLDIVGLKQYWEQQKADGIIKITDSNYEEKKQIIISRHRELESSRPFQFGNALKEIAERGQKSKVQDQEQSR